MTEEWREAKAEARGHDQKIWEYQRGYKVREAGRHEDEKAFRAFQFYLNSAGSRSLTSTAEACGNSPATVAKWYDTYNWDKRCASWDKQQMAITFREANKMERQRHRSKILKFRQEQEEQAQMMADCASGLLEIINRRIVKANMEDEDIPIGQLSNLIRAASNVAAEGRQANAAALGVSELMQVVEQELEENASVEEVDVYEIPLDE